LTLQAPATTPDTSPTVKVIPSDPGDPGDPPDGTTVYIDLAPHNDGNFTLGYASGPLRNGVAFIVVPNLTAGTTVQVRARLTDPAGNAATSNIATIQVTSATGWSASTQALILDPQVGLAREQLGELQVSHALDLDQSPGTSVGGNPAFVFDSARVSPQPIIQG